MTDMKRRVTDSPPEVNRRRVRNILRESRTAAGLTQEEAALRVIWSLSKLIRVENGPTAPAPADVRLLMLEYGAPEERVLEVVEYAKAARRPDPWQTFKGVYSAESRSLFANEPAASLIQKHEPSVVPGLLQTEDYANALLRGIGVEEHLIESMVQVRLARQEILDARDGPTLEFFLGEASVSRPIGGNAVMRDQLAHLKRMAERPDVTLRLVPFSASAYPGMGSAFTILQFHEPELSDLLYLEGEEGETVVRDNREVIDRYARYFTALQSTALPAREFGDRLDSLAKSLFQGH